MALALILTLFRPATAAGDLRILAPQHGATFRPGDQIHVVVESDEVVEGVEVTLEGAGTLGADLIAPFEFDGVVPRNRLGVLRLLASAGTPASPLDAAVEIVVARESPLTALRVKPPSRTLSYIGQSVLLAITAEFADGETLALSRGQSGIMFSTMSGGSGVVSVTPDGKIRAHSAGDEVVQVSFGGRSANVAISVHVSNTAPSLAPLAAAVVAPGTIVHVPLVATDADDDRLEFSAVGLPTFATIDDRGDGTGALKLSPAAQDAGYRETEFITVVDDGSPPLQNTQAIDILVEGEPPTPGAETPTLTPFATPSVAATATTSTATAPSASPTTSSTPTLPTPTLTPISYFLSGKSLKLKDALDSRKRAVSVKSKDANVGVTEVSVDPRMLGATLNVGTVAGCGTGTTVCNDTYSLPAAGWTTIGKPAQKKGFKYKDAKAAYGPIKGVLLQTGKTLKIDGNGAALGHRLSQDPVGVGITLSLGTVRYCLQFGGIPKFKQGKKDSTFSAADSPRPAGCRP